MTASKSSNRPHYFGHLDIADVDGDWLEAADATCNVLVVKRRREILEVYRHGWLDSQSVVCSEATKDCPDCPETVRCACQTHCST